MASSIVLHNGASGSEAHPACVDFPVVVALCAVVAQGLTCYFWYFCQISTLYLRGSPLNGLPEFRVR